MENKGVENLYIAVIALIVVVAGIVGCYFVLSGGGEGTQLADLPKFSGSED